MVKEYEYELNWDGSSKGWDADRYEPRFVEVVPPAPPEPCTELIADARAKGKWLYELTNHVYFSPDALERLQAEGSFRWSPMNFKFLDPNELETNPYFRHFSGYPK